MSHIVTLPFGRRPYHLDLGSLKERGCRPAIIHPPVAAPARPLDLVLRQALDAPVGFGNLRPLQESVPPGANVVIIVSDDTRNDPRAAMLRALLERMPEDIVLTIAVANGTHGPSNLDRLSIPNDIWSRATVVNHDAHDDRDMVTIGKTRRGTPVRLHRCLTEADWIVATGRIKPHYFAGYGAGCKAIFPGLGANDEIRINHRLKSEPGARAGIVDGNPCREDLEEAVAMLPGQCFLLNVVLDDNGGAQGAVAGDIVTAFRAGVDICEPLYRVSAPSAELVIVSDALPVTASLYQASKLAAATAGLLQDGGTLVVVAECPEGIGPVDTVNRAIYEIGIAPRLPAQHRIVLVSDLSEKDVIPTYCDWAPSVESLLEHWEGTTLTILPRAGALIVDRDENPKSIW